MWGFFLIFTQLIFGAGIYQLFAREERLRMEHWLFGYPLGAYLFTQVIFFEGISGIPLTATAYILTSIALVVSIVLALSLTRGSGFIPASVKNPILFYL